MDLSFVPHLVWALVAAVIVGFAGYLRRTWIFGLFGNLSGHWKATFTAKDKSRVTEDINIIAFVGVVRGTSTSEWTEPNGQTKKVNYKIRGRCRERTIVASYIATDQGSLDMGVFIVRIGPSGTVGDGIVTSYDSPTLHEEFAFTHLDASHDYHWHV